MATLLAITVLLPLLGSLVLVLMPRLEAHTARLIGLGFALVTLALQPGLALGVPRGVERAPVCVRGGGRPLWLRLDRAARHPLCPRTRRPLIMALYLDIALGHDGIRGFMAVDH